ncbi:16S rRNA (cytosine(967)-C(5))-methyltransferase RsmB [Glaciecola punicea]|jgi:16S rRNA (cytosine967-C5)-methyltransferase|uniref:16S rRNA (cytosine(967)-C(5))-methyltransferase RsmB n=1 Tax=Glaciecola punicea TaxID=56804 RepID=UPI0009F57615|nr:16S rRNA (cytosine(967)-C(5))-methyltransferase RsmB [Glaciecola punicea]
MKHPLAIDVKALKSAAPSKDLLFIKHPVNKRSDASWVLFQILEHGRSASEVMPIAYGRYEKPQERAWLQEMVYGCLRNLPELQVWLRQLLNKPLKKQQKIIEHLLMLGMYQLAYSRTAEHAAVSETVDACKQMKEIALSGLVNAVLRRFQRENIEQQVHQQAHINLGLPKWLYKALVTHYGESHDIAQLAKQMHTRAPLWLRVNTQNNTLAKLEAKLQGADYSVERVANNTLKISNAGEILSIPGFAEGHFAIQDLAAQQAARILDTQQGDIVLDCCAAPGGKSASILEHQPRLGHLYMLDADEKRMQRVHENFERLGHSLRFNERLSFVVQNAAYLSENSDLPKFDRILLDAPCSATGVIRKHPDIMWLRKPNDINVLVDLQKQILASAWQTLKSGGTLVYATCSILPQENIQQIEDFLATHNDATLEPITTHKNETLSNWQILPGQDDMDGFFYAKLRKA